MTAQKDSIYKVKWKFLLLTLLQLVSSTRGLFTGLFRTDCPPSLVEPKGPRVFLTVSSLAFVLNDTHVVERQLEMNWYNANPEKSDWVGIFERDPKVNWSDPLAMAAVHDQTRGFHRTSIMLSYYEFSPTDLKRRCLDFWIGYIQNGRILDTDCLKIQPDWMWESREYIGNCTLSEIVVPGTHNSGSYQKFERQKSDRILARYKMCQDEDIWNQLVFGIRHLDLRIGYYGQFRETIWLNHEYLRIHPFRTSLDQIKTFINNTKEFVVLDFHRFPVGFRSRQDRHREFISFLEEELKEFMVPRSYGYTVTFNQLWARNQRLIVMYSSDRYSISEYLWPGLPQVWASTTDTNKLKTHIQEYLTYSTPSIWAAMAELTPNMWEIIANPKGSLRIYADQVNRDVTRWFRDEWWDRANIIATDFFLGNGIIDVAIEANKRRNICLDYYISKTNKTKSNDILKRYL